jgi:hypothetical protein
MMAYSLFGWLRHIARRFPVPVVFLYAMPGVFGGTMQQAAEEKPLPAIDDFLKEVKGRLRSDRSLLSSYAYKETDVIKSLDGKGNAKSTRERIYDVYPSPEPKDTYRRLVVKDGKPVSQKEIREQDREHDKKLKELSRKLEGEGVSQRERRLAKEAEEKRKEEKAIDDLFRIYEIRMEGREWIDEHPVIILSFQPRPKVKPQTDEGKMLAKAMGRAWISETEYELIKIEAQLIDTLSFGAGLLVRLKKGATVFVQRRKVNDEIWLPAEAHFKGSGRVLLLKGINIDVTARYSDFHKFAVETQIYFDREE